MSEWQSQNIGTLIRLITKGTTPNKAMGGFSESGINYIKSESISYDGRIDSSKFAFIDEKVHQELKRSQLQKDDILFSMAGAYLGKSAIVQEEHLPANTNQALAIIRLDQSKAYPKFINYFFRHPNVIDYVNNLSGQSAQPNINFEEIKSIEVGLPILPEQKAIATVLSSLDDKIDLLHRQNKTLEAMAETLFRQWFIEEASEDWEEVPLSEVAVIQNGYAFSSRDYVEKTTDEYEVLKMGHIDKNSTLKLNPKRDYVPRKPELKKFVLNYNDIVMPMTDMKDNVVILGVPALVDASDKYVLNQRVARIYLKEDSKLSSTYYLFLQLKDPDFIARLQSTANSGVQVNLSTQAIKDCPIVIPSVEKQAEHKKDIVNFYDRLSNNRKKIQILEKLRDTLLPKLMSGEVRVQYQTETTA